MNRFLPILLIIIFLGGAFYFWFTRDNKNEVVTNSNAVTERAEFYEDYIDFVYDKDNKPMLLDTVNDEESKIFIDKATEVNLHPDNILKAGNELFFTALISKDGEGDGVALFTYDVILRKFRELYFYKKDESGAPVRFVLKAIDVTGHKLVLVLQNNDLQSECDSLWLEQKDNFYTFDLRDSNNKDLARYIIPDWKTEEEEVKSMECNDQLSAT